MGRGIELENWVRDLVVPWMEVGEHSYWHYQLSNSL